MSLHYITFKAQETLVFWHWQILWNNIMFLKT